MFEAEATALSTATPEALWVFYSDVSRWPSWDEALRAVKLDGPFEAGTHGVMEPQGQSSLAFKLTEVTPNVSFANEARVGPMAIRFSHTLSRLTGGTRITHRVTVEGPGAEQLGASLAVKPALEALARLSSRASGVSLGGVILYVPDVEKSVAFYEAAFGCEVAMRAPGGTYVQLSGPVPLSLCDEADAQTSLPVPFRPSRATEAPSACELMLIFADVPAAYARAVKAGAVGVVAPQTKPWGQVVSYVRDLNGVLVELCAPW